MLAISLALGAVILIGVCISWAIEEGIRQSYLKAIEEENDA